MRHNSIFAGAFLLVAILASPAARGEDPPAKPTDAAKPKYTFVLVHGAWGGGWAFKDVEKLLRADGHEVYRPTLTGLGERVHLATPEVDLTTHITDIVNVIQFENLHDIILMGHSYGGMVITGVADRLPERIKHVIYVDAFLPEEGESLNTAGNSGMRGGTRQVVNGFVPAGRGSESKPLPHDVPQPAKTLSEPISLKNQAAVKKLPTTYILTVDKGSQPDRDTFYRFYQRAKDRGWTLHTMEGDHNVQWSHPKELVELLEKAPAE